MQEQVIYQVQQKQQSPKSLISRLCSCFRLLRWSKRPLASKYQLGLDSPKSMSIIVKKMGRAITIEIQQTRKTLVVDLDETLVHSSFQAFSGYDFDIDIAVQGMRLRIFVAVRPGATSFLEAMSQHYDIILWTASLQAYADPVMDRVDINKRAVKRLFRESCTLLASGLTKDLSLLDVSLKDVIIIDNAENSFKLQPDNAYKILDFFFDTSDQELFRLRPFLKWISFQEDVRPVSGNYEEFCRMEKSDELDDKIFKDTNRVEYSQRHLLQKLESPPDQSTTAGKQVIKPPPSLSKMASLPKPSASKSLSLGRRKPEFDNQTSPNINSPHPEREHLAFKANNELKPTDEVESQEQTCLEEEGDLTEKN